MFAWSGQASAENPSAWDAWERSLNAQCPSHHVNWICDGCYLDLIDGFEARFSSKTRERARRIADYKTHCADEIMGFSCEMERSLIAYRQLGLLRSFTKFGCKHVKCEEPALCSKFP